MFDINECTLDWFQEDENKGVYANMLGDVVVAELPDILNDEFDEDAQYKANFMSVHKQMVAHVSIVGCQEPNAALNWWRTIENSRDSDLRKRKMYLAPLFIDAARAFLSVQASSASAERLFGDAGYCEGTRRKHGESSVTEMLLMIRSYVRAQIDYASTHNAFLSSRAHFLKDLAFKIAALIENKDDAL